MWKKPITNSVIGFTSTWRYTMPWPEKRIVAKLSGILTKAGVYHFIIYLFLFCCCAYKTIILLSLSNICSWLWLFYFSFVFASKIHLYCSSTSHLGMDRKKTHNIVAKSLFAHPLISPGQKQTDISLWIREWIATINCCNVQHAQQQTLIN